MNDRIALRRPVLQGLVAMILLLPGFGLWAALAPIDGAVIAFGTVEVESDQQVVQHPDGGVVTEILVQNGAAVLAGQVLLRLDGTLLQEERAVVAGHLDDLMLRAARLEAERDGSPELTVPEALAGRAASDAELARRIQAERGLFTARLALLHDRRRLLDQRLAQLRTLAGGLEAQARAAATERRLIEADLADQTLLLDKGLASAGRANALRRDLARIEGEIGRLAAAQAEAAGQETGLEIEREALETLRREEASTALRDLAPALLEGAARLRTLDERIARLELRAPVGGLVLELQVTTPRAVVQPAQPVLSLIPQDRPLIVRVKVAPVDVDRVSLGQMADLVFPGLHDRDLPPLPAVVTDLSADVLTDPASGQPHYLATLTLPAGGREGLKSHRLVPGMPVQVFLQTGRRTALAYLLQPLRDVITRAFRED